MFLANYLWLETFAKQCLKESTRKQISPKRGMLHELMKWHPGGLVCVPPGAQPARGGYGWRPMGRHLGDSPRALMFHEELGGCSLVWGAARGTWGRPWHLSLRLCWADSGPEAGRQSQRRDGSPRNSLRKAWKASSTGQSCLVVKSSAQTNRLYILRWVL